MARLLGHLGGQQPKTILSVIFGPFATNEETIFLKFQNKFFSLHPIADPFLKFLKYCNFVT